MNTHKNKGIIEIIIIIIIATGLLAVFGINPIELWNDSIKPILESAWKIMINAITFIVEIVVWLINKLGLTGAAR